MRIFLYVWKSLHWQTGPFGLNCVYNELSKIMTLWLDLCDFNCKLCVHRIVIEPTRKRQRIVFLYGESYPRVDGTPPNSGWANWICRQLPVASIQNSVAPGRFASRVIRTSEIILLFRKQCHKFTSLAKGEWASSRPRASIWLLCSSTSVSWSCICPCVSSSFSTGKISEPDCSEVVDSTGDSGLVGLLRRMKFGGFWALAGSEQTLVIHLRYSFCIRQIRDLVHQTRTIIHVAKDK